MKKQFLYKAFITSVWIIGLLGILLEVLNPHSFLTESSAFLRLGVILISGTAWIVFSIKTGRKWFNDGTFMFAFLMIAYLYASISLHCENYAYRNQISSDHYSCPMMLWR